MARCCGKFSRQWVIGMPHGARIWLAGATDMRLGFLELKTQMRVEAHL
jgi:hypothetical protein